MRKKRKRYKLTVPAIVEPEPPQRVVVIVTLIEWTAWFALAGVLVAFLLIASLYTSMRLGQAMWLNLWPASIHIMTARNLTPHQMTHLAFWMAGENGLLYGLIGILAAGLKVGLGLLWRRLRYNRGLHART